MLIEVWCLGPRDGAHPESLKALQVARSRVDRDLVASRGQLGHDARDGRNVARERHHRNKNLAHVTTLLAASEPHLFGRYSGTNRHPLSSVQRGGEGGQNDCTLRAAAG